jgi:hypothetical protein
MDDCERRSRATAHVIYMAALTLTDDTGGLTTANGFNLAGKRALNESTCKSFRSTAR